MEKKEKRARVCACVRTGTAGVVFASLFFQLFPRHRHLSLPSDSSWLILENQLQSDEVKNKLLTLYYY